MPNGSIPASVMYRLWNLKPHGSGIEHDPFERGLAFGVHSNVPLGLDARCSLRWGQIWRWMCGERVMSAVETRVEERFLFVHDTESPEGIWPVSTGHEMFL